MQSFISHAPEETLAIAGQFARGLRAGHRVALLGELGAGKTHFAKGIVRELSGVEPNEVTSPTFTLMEEYVGDPPLYHLDLYRITQPEEARALPWDEIFGDTAITLIEWPEHLENVLANCHFLVKISKQGESLRRIEIFEKEVQ